MSRTGKYNIGIWGIIVLLIVLRVSPAMAQEQILQSEMPDGVVLKVHLANGLNEEEFSYAQDVLQAARQGYQEIVFSQGFKRAGYTFSSPSRDFAYDNDKTIDIYIANVDAPFTLMQPGELLEFKAKILLPADYEAYRQKYNITQPELELKASLIHELLHVVTFFYNRNMQMTSQGKISAISKRWDWYVEGLARYFETLVGYREEYLSCGYRKQLGEKIVVYKGGINYFLRHPDRSLDERKYDFALFWQYIHQHYGMNKIEEISYKFRQIDPLLCSRQEAMQMVAQTLGLPLKNLLRNFSLYVYKISSLPSRQEQELQPIEVTQLSAHTGKTYSSVCSFGFDYYEVDLRRGAKGVQMKSLDGTRKLNCLIGIRSSSNFSSLPVELDSSGKLNMDLKNFSRNSKMIIMLSNPTDETISYRISVN